MNAAGNRRSGLTAYEAEQVRRIACWKSEPPSPFAELFKRVTKPGASLIERLIPEPAARGAIQRAYDAALATTAGFRPEVAGDLEGCDARAAGVVHRARMMSAAEGAATGVGGVFKSLLDVPILFGFALRTIIQVGRCYGYALDDREDRPFVLGVLITALSGSLSVRRERLDRLHEVEDLLLEEVQEEVLTEEAAALLFQVEVFEDVPGVGAVSGAILNLAFMKRIGDAARYVFRERWLRDRGKVESVAPAEIPERHLAEGWAGTFSRVAHQGVYSLGFGLALPAWLVLSLFRSGSTAGANGKLTALSASA